MVNCSKYNSYLTIIIFVFIPFSLCQSEKLELKTPGTYSLNELEALTVDPAKEIVFVQTGSFSGHYKIYGELIRTGILTYFNRINKQGGIQGKQLKLISIDDEGGNPNICNQAINTLLEKKGVDLSLGIMGTRSLSKITPLMSQGKIAVLFPWGGDKTFRDAKMTHLVNGLGDLRPQIDELMRYLIKDHGLTTISLFHSDSDFDTANAEYAKTVMEHYGIKVDADGDYNRFTMNLENCSKKLLEADSRVVVCLSSSMPAVKLINIFLQAGNYGTLFYGIDSTLFVGTILKPKGVPFTYTSSVPNPFTSDLEIVKEYRDDLAKEEQPNILSLAYYIHAAIVCDALKGIKDKITKEKLLKAIENMHKNLSGFEVDFDAVTRQAYPQHITLIKG